MNKLLTVLMFFIISTSYSQWSKVSAPNEQYFGLDFLDENTGFVMTWSDLYKTENGGLNWQNIIIPGEGDNLKDVFMIDENTVWCTETSNSMYVTGLLSKSVDGGSSWETKFSSDSCDFRNLYFYNENLGFLCTDKSYYFYTTDGGETWLSSGFLPIELIKTFSFVSEDTGWMCGGSHSGIVAKTTDGGITWETQLNTPIVDIWFLEIEFVNAQKGFVGGYNRTLFVTDDGGNTWDLLASEQNEGVLVGVPDDYDIRGIEFIDDNFGWIAGGHC